MTTLVIEELLATTLVQEFTVDSSFNVTAIRPYIYVHNSPAGTFTISLTASDDTVLQSQTFVAADVYTALATLDLYAHAFFTVSFANVVPLTMGTYKIKLSSSGYTFSEPSYLGWVKEHENLKVQLGYTPTNDTLNPQSYELWGYA